MTHTSRRSLVVAAVLVGACSLEVAGPAPPEQLDTDPSPEDVAAAVAGLVSGSRADVADWILDAGIIGREAYRFDASEPRYITELLQGPLDAAAGAFGGDHWLEQYRNIRSADELLNVIGSASQLSGAARNAVRGFAETIRALDFLMVLMGHAEDSIPVDVNRSVTAPPAPFVSNDSAYTFVSALLDTAQAHLAAGGTTFPFPLPPGFTGFTTPATFLRFNRALKARVEVYRGSRACGAPCYAVAKGLLETPGVTFIDTSGAATLGVGVYHNYATMPGDLVNPLFQDPQTGDNLAHPALEDSAESTPGGGLDQRFTGKIVGRPAATGGVPALTSALGWTRYGTAAAPIPVIRNEELILLRAEANNALGSPTAAAADINYVRAAAGGLASVAGLATGTQAEILDELLRQRRYSLLFEGHRWVDLRRLGRLGGIPIDRPGVDVVHRTLPTPLEEVLARR